MTGRNYDTEVAVGLLLTSVGSMVVLAVVVVVEAVQKWRRSR